jgi:hypothetical protein
LNTEQAQAASTQASGIAVDLTSQHACINIP